MAMPRLPAELMLVSPEIRIYGGEAENYEGNEQIDYVFTNPYGKIPENLMGHPMIIHQWLSRKSLAESYVGTSLDFEIGRWNNGTECWWTGNMTGGTKIDVSEFVPEKIGWHPYEMVRRILAHYVAPGMTIWDGFAGRGTVAMAARDLGIKYVGVELLAKHVAISKRYLGL